MTLAQTLQYASVGLIRAILWDKTIHTHRSASTTLPPPLPPYVPIKERLGCKEGVGFGRSGEVPLHYKMGHDIVSGCHINRHTCTYSVVPTLKQHSPQTVRTPIQLISKQNTRYEKIKNL